MSVFADIVVALPEAQDILQADTFPHLTNPIPDRFQYTRSASWHSFSSNVLCGLVKKN